MKCFTKQEIFLLNFWIIILQWYLKENLKQLKRQGLKYLTPKQILQRLPIALALVKAGNNSEDLLNEIRQIAYSLYQSKEITKKVYNNIIKSTEQNYIQL